MLIDTQLVKVNGSFVQTTSVPAVHKLKKYYDRILGVGAGGAQGVVCSPYIITAVQDKYGASVFRLRSEHIAELYVFQAKCLLVIV